MHLIGGLIKFFHICSFEEWKLETLSFMPGQHKITFTLHNFLIFIVRQDSTFDEVLRTKKIGAGSQEYFNECYLKGQVLFFNWCLKERKRTTMSKLETANIKMKWFFSLKNWIFLFFLKSEINSQLLFK